jgi:Dolichyl-phosphate-mannose-protein mannosyltransferase
MQQVSKGNPYMRYLQGACFLLILVAGMFFRLGTAGGTIVDTPVRNDAKEYVAYAWNLKYHGIYSLDSSPMLGAVLAPPEPDAVRPPAYPWLLRIFMGRSIDYAFVYRISFVQAWIAGITLLCSMLLAMRLIGAWGGLAVGALLALSPHQSVYVSYLLTETLYGATLVMALGASVLAIKAQKRSLRYGFAVLAGVLFGLTCLTRPTLNQWVPFLLLLLVFPAMRRFRFEILTLTLGFVLMMSPWWIRNEISVHKVSDSLKALQTVQQGSYPDFMYEGRPETYRMPYYYDPAVAKIGKSWALLFADLRDKFAERPLTMVRWYLFGKIMYFFDWQSVEGWTDMFAYPVLRSPWLTDPIFTGTDVLMHRIYTPLILFGLLGTLVAFFPRSRVPFSAHDVVAMRFLALLHIFVIMVHVVGTPIARYSVPFRPLTFLLSVFFVVWIYRGYNWQTRNLNVDTQSQTAA